MLKIASRALFAAMVLAPATALAHPGDHEGMTVAQGLHHLFTEPDHLAMLAAIVALAALGGWWLLRRRGAR